MSNLVIGRDKEGNVISNGYGINNMFLRCGLPLSSVHNDCSIPMGLVLIGTAMPTGLHSAPKTETCDTVTDAIYDKLLALARANPRKAQKTRRHSKGNKNKTKKKYTE